MTNDTTETKAIIAAYLRSQEKNIRGALATVVSVEGSAYRRPGVKMFITEDGESTGLLSGGCLERDVCERAAKVIESGRSMVVRYDTTSDDDIVFGLGVGCKGVVRVLIEPTTSGQIKGLMRLLDECSTTQHRGAVATVIDEEGETVLPIGSRVLLYPTGEMETSCGEKVGPVLLDDLRDAVHRGVSLVKRYEFETGSFEVFLEVSEPQLPLVIFGAGDDALPLVSFARSLGWHTTVVDTRARALSNDRFNDADEVVLCVPEEVRDLISVTERTAVVVMTHNYLHDVELLRTLSQTPLAYLGCVGPKRRTERILWELMGGDEDLASVYLDQLHAPAGLDIGAETPVEIALSVVSEIGAVLKNREGGLLRKRIGSIHEQVSAQQTEKAWARANGSCPAPSVVMRQST